MRITEAKKKRTRLIIDESTRKKTFSTIFLLPAIGIAKEIWDRLGFVNCYIGDDKHDIVYKNALYILLEPSFDEDLERFIKEQATRDIFLEDYDVGDHQIVLVYRFPPEYVKDYNHFKKGEYSKFSKKYINEHFPMTKKEYRDGKSRNVSTVFAGIFNKESWLKKYWEDKLGTDILPDEYWSIPDDKKEVLRYKQ